MVCQVPEAVTEALRAEVADFLKTRPDITTADLAQYTTLADSTVRHWLGGRIPGGFDVQGQMRRVLDQARAGDILAPAGAPESVFITEDPAKRAPSIKRRR